MKRRIHTCATIDRTVFCASRRMTLIGCAILLFGFRGSCARADEAAFSILVFSKTLGFRHESIPVGIKALEKLAGEHDYALVTTEIASSFNDTDLARIKVVVFLNTTGNVLEPAQQDAFKRFIQSGGGYVGIHSACDTEFDWPWYGNLVGAYFKDHPAIQEAVIHVTDISHPSTCGLPSPWIRTDEWYNFRSDPSEQVNVLLSLDETSYNGGSMGSSHPIAWYHEYDGGRAWYTALGHTDASYAEKDFLNHLNGGILWAAGGESPVMPQSP